MLIQLKHTQTKNLGTQTRTQTPGTAPAHHHCSSFTNARTPMGASESRQHVNLITNKIDNGQSITHNEQVLLNKQQFLFKWNDLEPTKLVSETSSISWRTSTLPLYKACNLLINVNYPLGLKNAPELQGLSFQKQINVAEQLIHEIQQERTRYNEVLYDANNNIPFDTLISELVYRHPKENQTTEEYEGTGEMAYSQQLWATSMRESKKRVGPSQSHGHSADLATNGTALTLDEVEKGLVGQRNPGNVGETKTWDDGGAMLDNAAPPTFWAYEAYQLEFKQEDYDEVMASAVEDREAVYRRLQCFEQKWPFSPTYWANKAYEIRNKDEDYEFVVAEIAEQTKQGSKDVSGKWACAHLMKQHGKWLTEHK
jgi:hypothetical protein